MIQLALVGAAHIHTPGFINTIKKRSDLKVKCVWDHDSGRAAKRAGELGASVGNDLPTILRDPDIKAVIVCSETNRHEQLVLPIAEARKHLFVEKPLGFAAADAARMAQAIEQAGVIFQTGYFRRGDHKHIFLKKQIEAGAFGQITRIRGSNCHSGSLGGWFDTEWRWMADPAIAGCGAFGDLGTHMLDILIWLMGDVVTATAMLDKGTGRYGDCDETGEGLMRFKNGAIGTLAAAWTDLADPVSLIISGTEGFAYECQGELFFQSKKVEGANGKQPWADLPPNQPAGLDAWLDAIVGKPGMQLVTAREAAYRSAVMEAMYSGAKQGTWVPVK